MSMRGMLRSGTLIGAVALLSVFILTAPPLSQVAKAQAAAGGASAGYPAALLASITITREGDADSDQLAAIGDDAAYSPAEGLPILRKQEVLAALANEPVIVDEDNTAADGPGGDVQIAQATDGVNDPLEPVNRIIFYLNDFLIEMFLKPFTEVYDLILPTVVKDGIGNVLDNLRAPVILVNDLLQGEGERAWQTTQRFLINSTIGIGGIFDVAEAHMGIPEHDEDFGQTLAVWGTDEMFYLVLPIFGPSSPRDAVGKLVVDSFFDPFNIWWENANHDELIIARAGLSAFDSYNGVREELDQIKKTSVDYYAAVRSMYRQKRQSEIRNGEDVDLPPIPDLSYEFDEEDILFESEVISTVEPDAGVEAVEASLIPVEVFPLAQVVASRQTPVIVEATQVAALPEVAPRITPVMENPTHQPAKLSELFPMNIVVSQ